MSAQIRSIDPKKPNAITVLIDTEEGLVVTVRVDGKSLCAIDNASVTWLNDTWSLDARMSVMNHAWREYVRRDEYEDFTYTTDIFHDILMKGE